LGIPKNRRSKPHSKVETPSADAFLPFRGANFNLQGEANSFTLAWLQILAFVLPVAVHPAAHRLGFRPFAAPSPRNLDCRLH